MLRIFLFGGFRVELDGKLIEETAWTRRKVKNLLKLLALQPDYRLHKEQVLDWLWPDLDALAASSNLYRNLHLLRQTLQPGLPHKAESSFITLKEEIVRLSPPEGLWVDVEVFGQLLTQAHTAPDPTLFLEEAVRLYQGDLLPEDLYEEWTLLRREELRRNFYQALFSLAVLYRQQTNYTSAIAALQRILTNDATNESAHRELIMTYTLAGQRSDALTQYQRCLQVLSDELGLDPSPETLELYQQVLTGEIRAIVPIAEPVPPPAINLAAGAESPLKAVAAPASFLNNLPSALTSLVGREEEVEQTVALLQRPEVRLVTLVGLAGVGKTRVALQAAVELLAQNNFVQGVCFVPLGTVTDPAQVPLAIAEAAGIREAGGQSPLTLLKIYLRDQQLLLMLDNFEQLTQAAGVLSELLQVCPQLKMLVTSRAVLHLYGEHQLVIRPLPLPASRLLLPLEGLDQSPAVNLFIQRARAAQPDFSLTAENAPAIVEICYRLDGLPLAIELVAAWVKLLSPENILARLTNWLHLMSNSARDLPDRQQSLHQALDWSYELLNEEERRLFTWLGVFAQGCTLEAIEVVCMDNANAGVTSSQNQLPLLLQVLNQTAALVDKSLLYQREVMLPPLSKGGKTQDTRFGMFEIIRDYALHHLSATGQAPQLREKHLDFFLELVERAEPDMHSRDLQAWLNRLELEHANLRALLEWSLEENQTDIARLEKGARVVGALYWFWHYRGYWSEGIKWAEIALSHPLVAALPRLVQAKVMYTASWMNVGQGNLSKANILLEESFAIYQEYQDKWGITHTMDAQAEVARQQGNYAKAGPLYQAGLELCNELHDQFCANYQLIGLGYVNFQQGEYQSAQTLLQDGLASSLELDDHYGAARALNGLGELLRREGDYLQARDYYEQSLAMNRKLGHTGNVVMVLHNLGQVELELNHYEKAAAYFKGSLMLAYEIQSKRWVSWCLSGLAGVSARQGEFEQAARLFGAAQLLMEELGIKLDSINQAAYDREVATLRQKLNQTAFTLTWKEGRKLSTTQAISLVLHQGVISFEPG